MSENMTAKVPEHQSGQTPSGPSAEDERQLVEEACRIYDRGRARDFDNAVEPYKRFMREEFTPVIRATVAALASRAPAGERNEAQIEAFAKSLQSRFGRKEWDTLPEFSRVVWRDYAVEFLAELAAGAAPDGRANSEEYRRGIEAAAKLVDDDAGFHSSPWLVDQIRALGAGDRRTP